ncbi:MAG: glycosyltransferase [Nitrospirae bacterium]|nr:MAG: glycosyltransferase [Nitrospirota bacterium]
MTDSQNTEKLRASIVIPTYNRPDDLRNCIESILKQTVRPYEIIVVDDGNLADVPLRKECEDAGIKCVYFKKQGERGSAASKNIGAGLAGGDIVLFLDDDVILYPDYIEEILRVYTENRYEDIGGVGGIVANTKPLSRNKKLRHTLEAVFLISGNKEGKVLPSGFTTNYGSTGTPYTQEAVVDFLPAGVSSFKKEIFARFSFDAGRFQNYSLGEDKEFSYQVSKTRTLVLNPKARLLHMESPIMKPDNFKMGLMYINFCYLFFTRHVKKGPLSAIFFWYAVIGLVLSNAVGFMFSGKQKTLDHLKGLLTGIRDIISGKGGFVR